MILSQGDSKKDQLMVYEHFTWESCGRYNNNKYHPRVYESCVWHMRYNNIYLSGICCHSSFKLKTALPLLHRRFSVCYCVQLLQICLSYYWHLLSLSLCNCSWIFNVIYSMNFHLNSTLVLPLAS